MSQLETLAIQEILSAVRRIRRKPEVVTPKMRMPKTNEQQHGRKICRERLVARYESLEIIMHDGHLVQQFSQTIQEHFKIIEETIAQGTPSYKGEGIYEHIASYSDDKFTYHLLQAPDLTQRVPAKMVDKQNLPTGLYGFTYPGSNYMGINEKLDTRPLLKEETMIHEAIHTLDEYETRVITWWMMEKYVVGVEYKD